MNCDEIRKALEIIKEPITVNCIEYKYFDQENYDKITRVYDNCLWFANNLEQINLTVEKLEQEKQETISFIRKELSDIEIELITPKPDIYDLGLLRGRYGTYKEILSKLDVLKITEKSDK